MVLSYAKGRIYHYHDVIAFGGMIFIPSLMKQVH